MDRKLKSRDGKRLARFSMNLKTSKTTFDCVYLESDSANILKSENIHSFAKAKQWIKTEIHIYDKL